MTRIRLTNTRRCALVNDSDVHLVTGRTWRMQPKPNGKKFYVVAVAKKNGRQTTIRMHRLVMRAKPWHVIDHRNHNGLDNRRRNLRKCSNSQNTQHRRKLKRLTSKYKGVHANGVYENTGRPRWRACIRIKNRLIALGTFRDERMAAAAYNYHARRKFRAFALLNKVPERLEVLAALRIHSPFKRPNSSSRFYGVQLAKVGIKRWHAYIRTKGRNRYIGGFTTELQAAKAYNKAASKAFGKRATLNTW